MKWICANFSAFTDAEYEEAYTSLSPSRKMRIDKKKRLEDRKRSLLGELLLKKLLTEEGMANAVIESDENGRPYLKALPFFISISHSGNMAACALSDKPIGIDIEKKRKTNLKLINRICTKEEKHFIEQSPDKSEAFLEIWTAKEAYFKKQTTEYVVFSEINTLSLTRRLYKANGYIINVVYDK